MFTKIKRRRGKARGVNSSRKGKVDLGHWGAFGLLLPIASFPTRWAETRLRFSLYRMSVFWRRNPHVVEVLKYPQQRGRGPSGRFFFSVIVTISDFHLDCCYPDNGENQRDSDCWMIWAFFLSHSSKT